MCEPSVTQPQLCWTTHWNDDEDCAGLSVHQQDVYEGDDLQRLPQAHAVSEDAAKPSTLLILLQRLNQVVK